MSSTDEASVRFNKVSSQWDTKPSTLAATGAASSALRSMDWYIKAADAGGGLRGMDFGCGTGLLTQRVIAGSDGVFSGGVVGVDVAEGMVDAFKEKLEGRGHMNSVKITPITIDLAQTNLGL